MIDIYDMFMMLLHAMFILLFMFNISTKVEAEEN